MRPYNRYTSPSTRSAESQSCLPTELERVTLSVQDRIISISMTSTKQRDELHAAIWGIANEVRGAVDGWDFKQFVLGALFYRFISEHFASHMEAGDPSEADIKGLFADFDTTSNRLGNSVEEIGC